MFFGLIDDIVVMQQSRRKRVTEEDEADMHPALTSEALKSERVSTKANDTEHERSGGNMKLKREEGWRKYCCLG